MKIRTVKPGFFLSEKMGLLTPRQRLLFIAMWLIADDAGILENKPKEIVMQAFPWDLMGEHVQDSELHMQCTEPHVQDSELHMQCSDPQMVLSECISGLARLERLKATHSYTVGGRDYIVIRNFRDHQQFNRPSKTRYPLPNGKPRGQNPSDAWRDIDEHFRQLDATESQNLTALHVQDSECHMRDSEPHR